MDGLALSSDAHRHAKLTREGLLARWVPCGAVGDVWLKKPECLMCLDRPGESVPAELPAEGALALQTRRLA